MRFISTVHMYIGIEFECRNRWLRLEPLDVDVVLHVQLQNRVTTTTRLNFDRTPGMWNLQRDSVK